MARKNILKMESCDIGGVFPFSIMVVYKHGATIDQIIQEAAIDDINLKDLAETTEQAALSLVYKSNGSTTAYIFIDDSITIDVLIHESVHITCRLFNVIGSEVNDSTEELFAYINTFAFKEVYRVATQVFKLKPKMLYEA